MIIVQGGLVKITGKSSDFLVARGNLVEITNKEIVGQPMHLRRRQRLLSLGGLS